jgi:hypothetical protein
MSTELIVFRERARLGARSSRRIERSDRPLVVDGIELVACDASGV